MDSNSLDEVRQSLYQLMDDVVDTVATFDGRFSYTLTNTRGECFIRFAASSSVLTLLLTATVSENGDVKVELTDEGPNLGDAKDPNSNSKDKHVQDSKLPEPRTNQREAGKILYSGPFAKSELYQVIGAGLATWYGETVRSQSSGQ
ncbi:hypothetical protein JZ785_09255 [Alicyclobacillus curvatus]|nr:hypothetical protein JZ785_09255 [Alicyclobacillus curvatus]